MADEWNSFFNSDDDDSELEGFSPSDIDEAETRSIGSDISISEVDTDSSDDGSQISCIGKCKHEHKGWSTDFLYW